MSDKTPAPPQLQYTLLFGATFFIIGLIIDDLYTVITGASLLIIATILATGEKIMQKMDHPPKGL